MVQLLMSDENSQKYYLSPYANMHICDKDTIKIKRRDSEVGLVIKNVDINIINQLSKKLVSGIWKSEIETLANEYGISSCLMFEILDRCIQKGIVE